MSRSQGTREDLLGPAGAPAGLAWLTEPLQYDFMLTALLTVALVSVTCAALGVYVVLRRMAFIGDALAHTALPGLVVAYLNGWSLFGGALVAGVATALGIGWLSRRQALREDTAIGILFSGLFALGVFLLSRTRSFRDLTHMLFGNVLSVTWDDLRLTAALAGAVGLTLWLLQKELELTSVDPVHAAAAGLSPDAVRYILLVLLALTVVAGLQAVGVVLVSALLITPAAAASLLTTRLGPMLLLASAIALASAVAGLYLSYYLDVASGPAIVLVCTTAFGLAWALRAVRHRGALLFVLSLALLAPAAWAPPGVAAAEEEAETTAVRIAFTDFRTNAVSVLDGASGERLASFGMPGPGSLYGASGGRWFYAVHTAPGRVSVIDSGLRTEDHGDHADPLTGPPFVRGTVRVGRRPIDTWVQNGMLTVHSDDDGTLALFEDERLEVALDYTEIKGAGPGHNNGLVLGDHVLLSLASAGRVTAYRLDGSVAQTFEGCPGTHGWTLNGSVAAAGCADKVMLFTLAGDQLRASSVPHPPGTPEGTRVGTLRSHPASPVLAGNWGPGLTLIRPAEATMQPVPLPAAPLAFAFSGDGARLLVLTPDGTLHALDPASGRTLGSAGAVAPYVAPASGQPAAPRPALAVGNGVAYLSNPTQGQIVEVNTTAMSVTRRLDVGGQPASIGLVSLTGALHGPD